MKCSRTAFGLMMAMSFGALGARPLLTWRCALKRLATARWTWVHTHKKPSGVWDLAAAVLAERRGSFPGCLNTLFFSHLDFWIITVRLHPCRTQLWPPRGGDLLSPTSACHWTCLTLLDAHRPLCLWIMNTACARDGLHHYCLDGTLVATEEKENGVQGRSEIKLHWVNGC